MRDPSQHHVDDLEASAPSNDNDIDFGSVDNVRKCWSAQELFFVLDAEDCGNTFDQISNHVKMLLVRCEMKEPNGCDVWPDPLL